MKSNEDISKKHQELYYTFLDEAKKTLSNLEDLFPNKKLTPEEKIKKLLEDIGDIRYYLGNMVEVLVENKNFILKEKKVEVEIEKQVENVQ